MEHSEAVKQMATERYLLDELSPDQREAFEEHLFDCQECAVDLRAASAFVNEATVQLPGVTAGSTAEPIRLGSSRVVRGKKSWFSWLTPIFATPAFAAPAFAALLLVVGYQNLVTLPAMRTAANEPHLTPWASLHTATRGTAATPVAADSKSGVVLLIDLPLQAEYASYIFELTDPQGKTAWTRSVAAPNDSATNSGTESLVIPGADLRTGEYTLTVLGTGSDGERKEVQRHVLDFHVNQ